MTRTDGTGDQFHFQYVVFSDILFMAILAGDHPRKNVKVRHSLLASENVTNNQP